jgi:hypothetical protein
LIGAITPIVGHNHFPCHQPPKTGLKVGKRHGAQWVPSVRLASKNERLVGEGISDPAIEIECMIEGAKSVDRYDHADRP